MLLFTSALPTSCFFPPVFGRAFPSNSHHMAAIESGYPLFFSKGSFYGGSGFARRCRSFYSGGDFALEAEILDFMEISRNPEAFPSKKDLIEGGRVDLVDAIVMKGDWLCLGWDLDEEQNGGIGQLYLEDCFGEINKFRIDERRRFPAAVSPITFSSSTSSFTGRPLETVSEHESGLEGMLSRLEKERNATFVTGKEYLHPETTAKENSSPVQINGLGGSVSSAVQRMWSTFKTDLQDGDFKDSEIALSEVRRREVLDVLPYETLGSREDRTNSNSVKEEMKHSQLQHHLQNLKLEVSSAIGSLKSNAFAYEKVSSAS